MYKQVRIGQSDFLVSKLLNARYCPEDLTDQIKAEEL
jgi:hypothetical protein